MQEMRNTVHTAKTPTEKEFFKDDIDSIIEKNGAIQFLVVAVQRPTGAMEVIVNSQDLDDKIEYYMEAYDDDLQLKANNNVKIVNWMVV